MREARGRTCSVSNAKLLELQQAAAQRIGTKDPARVHGLVTEQKQLIRELELIGEHLAQLEAEMNQIVNVALLAQNLDLSVQPPEFLFRRLLMSAANEARSPCCPDARHQRLRLLPEIPRSLETWLINLSLLWTNRTASILNPLS
jgi:hypothetical protein